MAYTIKTKDLARMTSAEREKVLGEIVQSARAPRNGQATVLDAKIRGYEQQYEMTSEDLLLRLSGKEIRETSEIAEWLFWLNVRNDQTCGPRKTRANSAD